MRTLFRTCLLTAALLGAASGVALADSAALDPAFGQPTVINADNNFVVAHLARPSGGSVGVYGWTSTDPANCPTDRTCVLVTFYSETGVTLGTQTLRTFRSFTTVRAAALDSTGRIVIVGSLAGLVSSMRVVRLLSTGVPDPSFGDDGIRDVSSNLAHYADAVAIDSRDRIVAAGRIVRSSNDSDFVVTRLRNNGSNDPTFSTIGIRAIPFDLGTGTFFDGAQAVAVTRAGKIVLAGYAVDGNTFKARIAMAQLLDNGNDDVSFCASSCNFQGPYTAPHSGRRVTYFGSLSPDVSDWATALAVDSVGNSVIAGYRNGMPMANERGFAMRMAADGNWTNEVAISGAGTGQPLIGGVHIADEQVGGRRVIVTGTSGVNLNFFFAQRFSSSLVPASGWGSQGVNNSVMLWSPPNVLSDLFGKFPGASSIDPFGRLLVGGTFKPTAVTNPNAAVVSRLRVIDGILPDVIFRTNF